MNRSLSQVVLYAYVSGFLLVVSDRLLFAQASPTPFDASQIDYSKFTAEEIAATEAHRDQLKGEVKTNLSTIVTTSDSQAAALQQATKSLDLYDAAVKARIDQGNAAIASLAALVKKHHLDLLILIGLWLGVCGFLYLQVGMKLGLPGIIGAAALAAAGTGFILWRL